MSTDGDDASPETRVAKIFEQMDKNNVSGKMEMANKKSPLKKIFEQMDKNNVSG